MKKVLIITYYWPPAGGPGIQRIIKIVRHLPAMGWQPVILTVNEGDYPAIDKGLADDIPESCKVYKTGIMEPYNIYRKLTGKSSGEKIPTFVLNPEKSDSFRDKIAKWIRTTIFIPDARIGWIPYAVKAGKKIIAEEKIDLIFSSSPPQTVQLIAKKLAKKSGLKWVADFRDPWTEAFWAAELQKEGMVKKINQRLETSVLKKADAVVSVSEGVVDLLRKKAENQYSVIHNGFESANNRKVSSNKFTILFFGHLNKYQHRETLFKALSSLPADIRDQIELVFVGKVFDGFQRFLAQYQQLNVVLQAYMPYKELMEFAGKASILYRPLSNMSYAQSGVGAKTFDYLALRKPVLAIGLKDSYVEKILNRTGSGKFFLENEVPEMAEFLLNQFELWKQNGGLLLPDNPELDEFKTKFNVERLTAIFDDLTDSR